MFTLQEGKQVRGPVLSMPILSGEEHKKMENSDCKPHLFVGDDAVYQGRKIVFY